MATLPLFLGRVVGKLKNLVLFLLFMEEMPKHKVVESYWTVEFLIMLMFPMVFLGVAFLLAAYFYFGVVGFLVAYPLVCVMAVEIPHIICDR